MLTAVGFQAEWGYVYAGEVLVSAVDEKGDYQVDKLQVGDIWYFPKGAAHTVQGTYYVCSYFESIADYQQALRTKTSIFLCSMTVSHFPYVIIKHMLIM